MKPNYPLQGADSLSFPFASAADNVDAASASITGIQAGDLMWWDASNGVAKSANAMAWSTSELVMQKAFAKLFCGIAAGSVTPGRPSSLQLVHTRNELHKVNVESGTYAVGTLLGVAKQSGNALERGTLKAVTDPDAAIYVCMEKTPANTTWVRAEPIFRLFGDNPNEEVGDISFTFDAEGTVAADTRTVTAQVKNKVGNNLAGVRAFPLWLADSASAGPSADPPSGAVTATVGELAPITAKVHHYAMTNASGVLAFTVVEAGADSWFVRAIANGKNFTSAELAFA